VGYQDSPGLAGTLQDSSGHTHTRRRNQPRTKTQKTEGKQRINLVLIPYTKEFFNLTPNKFGHASNFLPQRGGLQVGVTFPKGVEWGELFED